MNELVNSRGIAPEHPIQRRYPRYAIDRPLVGFRLDWDTTVSIRGRWRQLGEGGAGAQIGEQLYPGEIIYLELAPSLKVYAAVRYRMVFYHGFEFVLLRESQKAVIKRLCEEARDRLKGTATSCGR